MYLETHNMAEKDNVDSVHLETNRPTGDDIQSAPAPAAAAEPHNPDNSTPVTGRTPKAGEARDVAAQFIKEANQPVVVTHEDNRRVLRRIDWRILPIILFVYALQSLDKTSLSYASVFGLIEDTNLVGDQFSWLGSVVYVAQLVFQPLIAWGLVKFPIGKFSSTMVLLWGSVLCTMAAAHNFGGLMATRLLLGTFEASVGMYNPGWRKDEEEEEEPKDPSRFTLVSSVVLSKTKIAC